MLKLELWLSDYFKLHKPLEMILEEKELFEQSTKCWLRDNPLGDEEVRDHDHLTGKYRGAAHKCSNLNCKQKSSSFFPIFFHNFVGYDCHLLFEQVLTRSFKIKNISCNQISIIPKSKEFYVSVQIGCSRFLDSYRFLSSGLEKLVKSLDSLQICQASFAVMDENGFIDELFEKKLANPYEYFTLLIFTNHLT